MKAQRLTTLQQSLLCELVAAPATPGRDLARALDRQHSSVYAALRSLEWRGLAASAWEPRAWDESKQYRLRLYSATVAGRAWLEQHSANS